MSKVSVVGAGAWGTSLSIVLAKGGNDVVLWDRNSENSRAINEKHENESRLPGIFVPESVVATSNLMDAVDCDVLLLVVPAQAVRETCEKLKEVGIRSDVKIVICSKGIEKSSLELMSEVVADDLHGNHVAMLSGPNFADEIAKGLPAATTIACEDKDVGSELAGVIGSQVFRVYYSDDIIGAQIGGAVKNVLAIACGIAAGKGLGENTKAAIVTRGLAEIGRLCKSKGGKLETLMGLSGIGDIVLTCSSLKSRNMSLGYGIGSGESLEDMMLHRKGVVEGVASSDSVYGLSEKMKVDMPICESVYRILHHGVDVEHEINELLKRPVTSESC